MAFSGGSSNDDGGFVAIDALIALTLVALVLGLVLNAVAVSLKSARAAAERRAAAVEAEYRLLSELPKLTQPASVSGATGRRAWSLTVTPRAPRPVDGPALCEVSAVGRENGRRVELRTVAFCPVGAP